MDIGDYDIETMPVIPDLFNDVVEKLGIARAEMMEDFMLRWDTIQEFEDRYKYTLFMSYPMWTRTKIYWQKQFRNNKRVEQVENKILDFRKRLGERIAGEQFQDDYVD